MMIVSWPWWIDLLIDTEMIYIIICLLTFNILPCPFQLVFDIFFTGLSWSTAQALATKLTNSMLGNSSKSNCCNHWWLFWGREVDHYSIGMYIVHPYHYVCLYCHPICLLDRKFRSMPVPALNTHRLAIYINWLKGNFLTHNCYDNI